MARSILPLGMFWARAAWVARLGRGFMAGSGRPILAAAVISRASLEKSFERFLSWAPLRNWRFLHFERPAAPSTHPTGARGVCAGGRPECGAGGCRAEGPPFRKGLSLLARQLKAKRGGSERRLTRH